MWNLWELFSENDQRLKFLWAPQKHENQAFEAHIQHPLKVARISMKKNIDGNQWKRFEKMTKDQNSDLFGGPKWLEDQASETHMQHASKSSSNHLRIQVQCESSGIFFSK